MRGNALRVAVPAVAVLALAGVVVIAAGGSTPTGTSASRQAPDVLLDSIISIGLVLLIPGAVLLLYALTQRKDIAREMQSKKYPRSSIVGWVLFTLLFALLTWYRGRDWQPPTLDDSLGDAIFPGESNPTTPAVPGADSYEPEFAWIPALAVAVLTVVAVTAIFLSMRRRRSDTSGGAAMAETIAEILDDTLDDLRAEADPRRAVIAAFARLERTFAAAGLPRRRAETPQEYVTRALLELHVAEASVARLGELFAVAKFSDHDVDAGMKHEAIDALEDVRDELRAAISEGPAAAPLRVGKEHA